MGRLPPRRSISRSCRARSSFGLQVERQLAHLVQKERAFVGQLHAADLAGDRAGERALLVPEQFALQQPGGNGGAVQLDERAIAARTQAVNGARQQLLAGSRFSLDQHGGIGGRDRFNLPEHLAQPFAVTHNVFVAIVEIDFGFEVLLLLAQLVAEFGNAPECHCVVDRHCHLNRNLEPGSPRPARRYCLQAG